MDQRRIGDILLSQGLVSELDCQRAARYQAEIGALFGQALLRLGALSEDALLSALSDQLGLPILTADDLPDAPAVYRDAAERLQLPIDWLLQHDTLIWLTSTDGAFLHEADALAPAEGGADAFAPEADAPTPSLETLQLNVFSRAPLEMPVLEAIERAMPGGHSALSGFRTFARYRPCGASLVRAGAVPRRYG